ncbi:MAG: hypothetical protein ACYCS7_05375 [Acidimicrobiales bacterium]
MTDTRSDIAHLYRRAGFGARPDELYASVLANIMGEDPKVPLGQCVATINVV